MDWINLLTTLGVSYQIGGEHKHVRPGWIGVNCPRCDQGYNKFHCGINPEAGFASCWQCGPIRLGDLLIALSGEPWSVVREWLDGLPRAITSGVKKSDIVGEFKFPASLGPLTLPYKRYLKSRGFRPKQIVKQWNIQATGPAGEWSWRLFLPITIDGVPVSWTTRTIAKKGARYLSAEPHQEAVPHRNLLYGEDFARHAVVITEGPLDAWAIGPGAVAIMGLSYTPAQIQRMSRFPIRAICFDSSNAAQKRAHELARLLQVFAGETLVLELETGEDAAEAEEEELVEIRESILGIC